MLRWLDMIAARQPLRRVALDVGMHAAAGMVDFLPQMKERLATSTLIEDVEYARHGDVTLWLDILQPQGPGPHSVLVYLHGGAFAIGSKRTHRALAAAYASRGYLVCNIDYRLAPKFPFPAALEDACAAWLWAADHVGDYGGDNHAMGLAGESAGTNLALAITLACWHAAPVDQRHLRHRCSNAACSRSWRCCTKVFLQSSIPQRYRRSGVSVLAASIATDAAGSYLGKSDGHPTSEHALADPLCVVEAMAAAPTLPPFFIAAGLDDPVAADSQLLEQALQRLQSPCSARYYLGETHGFHVMFWREQAVRCWRDSFEFLRQYLPVPVNV